MTIEQSKSELMQIYGALASNKQIAIDTLVKASVKPQESKSEWEHDHAILKAYSDGANEVLDKIRAEIKDIAFDWQEIDGEHESFMVVNLNDVLQIIDKYKAESEEER